MMGFTRAEKIQIGIAAAILEDTGIPWRVVPGGHHKKLLIGEGSAGAMLPIAGSPKGGRMMTNWAARIRRTVREMGWA